MPTLDWIGKSKVINHHLEVPFRILERQYFFDADGKHDDGQDSENMIIHGDNLEALKALLPRYEKRVRLCYIDEAGCVAWLMRLYQEKTAGSKE